MANWSPWQECWEDFLAWVRDPANAPLLPPIPLATLKDTWEMWRGKRDLEEDYTLSSLATGVDVADREGDGWHPAGCSPAEHCLIGQQLAQVPGSSSWPALQRYRRGPRGVVLHNGVPPAEKVKAVLAAVVPLPSRTAVGPQIEALNFFCAEQGVLPALGQAVLALLVRDVPQRALAHLLAGPGWFPPLWLACAFAGLLRWGWLGAGLVVIGVLLAGVVGLSWAGWRWAYVLRRSAVYLTIDGERGETISGASFGLPACLAILLALAEHAPSRFGVLTDVVSTLTKEERHRAYTGVVNQLGQVTKVDERTIAEKIEAMRAFGAKQGFFPAANGRFEEPWIIGVRSLRELIVRLPQPAGHPAPAGLRDWLGRVAPFASLGASCVLFFGAWWFWPQSAAIDGVRSQAFGNFYAGSPGSGDTLLTGYARGTDTLVVTISGRSLHTQELEVSVPEGAVHPKESSDPRGWQSSMTFRVQAPGSVIFLVRWDALGDSRSQGHPLSLSLRDHRHRLCSGKSLQVIVRE